MEYQQGQDVQLVLRTLKDSQSGLFTNQRLLLIKAGIISYFSRIPKQYVGSARSIELSGELPKFSVSANDVEKIELDGGSLSLLFRKSKLIRKSKIEEMMGGGDDRDSSGGDVEGYEKWIFKCQNQELMKEFFRLVNLFRGKNAKFRPDLPSFINGFQSVKKGPRQMSYKPEFSSKLDSDISKKRMSEVPQGARDSFLQKLQNLQKKPASSPIIKLEKNPLNPAQKKRISMAISRLSSSHHPVMGIIDENIDDDIQRISEPSRRKSISNRVISLHNQEVISYSIQEESKKLTSILPDVAEISTINVQTAENEKKIFNQQIKEEPKYIKEDGPQDDLAKPLIKQTSDVITGQISPQIKNQPLFSLSNSQKRNLQSTQEEKNHMEMGLILRGASMYYSWQELASKYGIPANILQESADKYAKFDDEWKLWRAKKNGLDGKQLERLDEQQKKKIVENSLEDYQLSSYYHLPLYDQNIDIADIFLQDFKQENIEKQQESLHIQSQLNKQILEIMKNQLNSAPRKTPIIKMSETVKFKIQTAAINYEIDRVAFIDGQWVLSMGGKMEQFLVTIRLQRILKDLVQIIGNDFNLSCASAIYLKYGCWEALAKEWGADWMFLPIESFKKLHFLLQCKDMSEFMKDFSNYQIFVQIIDQVHQKYRLHLVQGPGVSKVEKLEASLRRLSHKYNNELDDFFKTEVYKNLQLKCLRVINKGIQNFGNINEEVIYSFLQNLSSNIEVHIFCKILSCRIDKNGNIVYSQCSLRLADEDRNYFGDGLKLVHKFKRQNKLKEAKSLVWKEIIGLRSNLSAPLSYFIQIYLQTVDLMIISGEKEKSVQLLLKVLDCLTEYEPQQYSVYLKLAQIYFQRKQYGLFTKIFQNCKLFLSRMFKQDSDFFIIPLKRFQIFVLLSFSNSPKTAIKVNRSLAQSLRQNKIISEGTRQKYAKYLQIDLATIYLCLRYFKEAFETIQNAIQKWYSEGQLDDNYIQLVICAGRAWLNIDQVTAKKTVWIQKRLGECMEWAQQTQRRDQIYPLFFLGEEIRGRSKEIGFVSYLDRQATFEKVRGDHEYTKRNFVSIIKSQLTNEYKSQANLEEKEYLVGKE